jgi:outer membrane protein OmpA-like peptidoglycan-associated protein/osmotically-inducible protein OsmY
MLSWVAFNWERGNIEADLASRTQEALARQGLSWAITDFSGRDGVLRGRAADESEPRRAYETARGVWGVRVVEQRTDLLPKANVFNWIAKHDGGKVVMSGYVPSEAARKSLLSVAKANFPKASIDDSMKLARGAPAQNVWVSGSSFALRQLAQLRRGTVELINTQLSISGEALDTAAYKSVRGALGRLPEGIKLDRDGVQPAVANPFVFMARQSQNKLTLSGHVPSDKVREDVFASARKQFGKTAIVDRLEVAGGAPDGWSKAVSVALAQLALITEGTVDTKGAALKISGTAPDKATAEAISSALRGEVPATIAVSEDIRYPEPVAAAEPPAPEPPVVEPQLPATSPGGVQLDLRFGKAEEQVDPAKAEEEARRLAAEAEERRRAEEEAQRKAEEERLRAQAEEDRKRAAEERQRRWIDLELRWSAANEDYLLRRAQEEAQRREELARYEVRKAEADKCQMLMRDAVKNGKILFKSGNADLESRSKPTLDALAKIASACPSARIDIAGHTDSEGSEEGNKVLSENRARAVVAYLSKAGVAENRMTASGYGELRPVVPNTTAANKAKNRRIEFTVVAN